LFLRISATYTHPPLSTHGGYGNHHLPQTVQTLGITPVKDDTSGKATKTYLIATPLSLKQLYHRETQDAINLK
jgi:hypothetical protein